MTKTLECISNLVDQCELAPFGCDLISNAHWKGVRLSDIFNLVGGVRPGAAFVATISADEYTTALPMELAMSTRGAAGVRDERPGAAARAWLSGAPAGARAVRHEERQVGRRAAADAARVRRLVRAAGLEPRGASSRR